MCSLFYSAAPCEFTLHICDNVDDLHVFIQISSLSVCVLNPE